jgi:hypothetical protein
MMPIRRVVLAATLATMLGGAQPVCAWELDARVKWFGSAAFLPRHDLGRQIHGTPAYDDNFDLRLMLDHRAGPFRLSAAHSTLLLRGDDVGRLDAARDGLDRPAVSDAARPFDLTWHIDRGNRHRALHRVDRFAVQYRHDRWGVTVGRDAVSWGNGLVFQPMDLFNPFAPTAVDRDYKPGDDLVLIDRLFAGGNDLQLLAVGRRDDAGEVSANAGSYAAKWRQGVGRGELELLAARHFRDRVYGLAARGPLGTALWRADLVATDLEDDGWKLSGVINADYSLVVLRRNLYVFAEYFRNGFGVKSLPASAAGYPDALARRFARGELYSLMQNYLAAGGRMEWSALWAQEVTLIGNLHDGSLLLQVQFGYERGDHQQLQFGALHAAGRRGDEFGGVPITGPDATAGGGTRVYVRWAYYF